MTRLMVWISTAALLCVAFPGCQSASRDSDGPEQAEARYTRLRSEMVAQQLRTWNITDPRVLAAMERVPRHLFVPEEYRSRAYGDSPLPIGYAQTISAPYIVALMTQLVRPRPDARVLDVGTGSGYQAAVLAELVETVYSIEILRPLADQAAARLTHLGYTNVEVRCGDGYRGWPEHAPFDVIILAAAPDHIPQPLVEQLAPGGRLVLPVGDFRQDLVVVEKQPDGSVQQRTVLPVRFVPMTGEAQEQRPPND
jgi:protein-L-isoaspartate(D-aspartate) O-methyltransferase